MRSPTDRFALVVAYVVNPLILPPVLFGAVLVQFEAPLYEIGLAASAALVLMTALPFAFLWGMVRTGRALAVHVVEQSERTMLFLFGIVCALAASAAVFGIVETARPFVASVGGCIVVCAGLLALINLRWKISIHATAISGFVAILLFAAYAAAASILQQAWIVLLVPLVMWARVRTRSHSVIEVVSGAALGAATSFLVLYLLAIAGVF